MFSMIPLATREKLATSPLSQVICQVKFPIEAALATEGDAAAAQIHEKVEQEYPRLVKELRAEIQLTVEGPKTTQGPVWKFSDLEAQWSVVLALNHITLEAVGAAYTDWGAFRARFQRILEAVNEVLQIRVCERVGLRYINEIRATTEEGLRGTVRPTFLGPFSEAAASQLHQWLGQLHLREETCNTVIRYGLARSTEGLIFRIDTDCYDDKAKSYQPTKVLDLLTLFNDITYRAFAWVITPEKLEAFSESRDA